MPYQVLILTVATLFGISEAGIKEWVSPECVLASQPTYQPQYAA
jgi:hypothetical protein